MQVSIEYMNSVLNNDFKSLLLKKRDYEARPDVQAYLGIEDDIKTMKGQLGADMLNLYRTYGIQTVKGEPATVYVKDEYDVLRDRLTSAQIVAMFDYNPDAFKITDKAIRDTIEIAKAARANGDVSEGVCALLDLDMDKLRGPVKHSAVVRLNKF